MSKTVTPLIQRVRTYLKSRKTAATVEQVVQGTKVANPQSSVARSLRSLVELGEAVNTMPHRKGARYLLTR